MSVIKVTNFGGEIPRLLPRSLPADAAKENANLLATSSDFRPVMGPSTVAAAEGGAISLYRRQRDSNGALLANDSEGWITSSSLDINFVRGQINDDTTERTYQSFNDGSRAPRVTSHQVISGRAVDFQLGVPAPEKPSVALLKAKSFTYADAREWLSTTLAPTVADAIRATLSEDQCSARFTDLSGNRLTTGGGAGKTVAGVTWWEGVYEQFPKYPASQRGADEPYNIMMRIPAAYAVKEGLGNPQLGGTFAYDPYDGSNPIWIGVSGLPLFGVLDQAALRARLAGIKNPRSGAVLWNATQLDEMVAMAAEMFSPTATAVMSKRKALDDAVRAFANAGYNSIQNYSAPAAPTAPAAVGEQFIMVTTGTGDAMDTHQEINPAWDAWKRANDEYLTRKSTYDKDTADWKAKQAAYVAEMVAAQKSAADISHEIEQLYIDLKADLAQAIENHLSGQRLVRTDDYDGGLVVVDPDSSKDPRFYATTWVTVLDEESAPSAPSDMLDVDVCDLVLIKRPVLPASVATGDTALKAWRIYRSNSGASSAAFRFVAEVALNQTLAAPLTASGSTEGYAPGLELTHKWRDVVATWQIYSQRGETSTSLDVYTSTAKLVVGDTATQSNPTGYSVTKTWNGSRWTMNSVPATALHTGSLAYIDGLDSQRLGEVCPTLNWLMPPTVKHPTSGVTTHLKGLTSMANGSMAGFIDNMVAFCEPYVPYAWKPEYQHSLNVPAVGLCSFGKSMLVGTKSYPYIFSSHDSPPDKLEFEQGCVSARSMVAGLGGVFYASPDGYCFANQSGVEVVTLGLFSNEDWQKLKPSSIFAVVHDSVLYFWTNDGTRCFGLDMVAKKLTRHDLPCTAVFADVVTDSVYAARGGQIARLFSATGARATGVWHSGIANIGGHAPFAWLQVDSEFDAGSVKVDWYGDGDLVHSVEVTNSSPERVPPGRYLEHQIRVTSKSRVTSVTLAGTTEELKKVA